MKKTAIILLALIVGLCLAHGAFAEEYMAILIGVDSGNVERVLAATELGHDDPDPNHPGVIILRCKKATDHEGLVPNVIDERTYKTKFAISSPGCRYIFWNGRYVKVCSP